MKKPLLLKTELPDPKLIVDVISTNPFLKSIPHTIDIFKEILPELSDEYKVLAVKANKRLEAMVDVSEENLRLTMETYRVKLSTYIQKRSMELMIPKLLKFILLNPDVQMDLSPKHAKMADQLFQNKVSDEFVKVLSSIIMSFATANDHHDINPERTRFLRAQFKDPKSNCSTLIRESINSLGDLHPQSLLDVEKWRNSLTDIFSDELNEQCKLLSSDDNSNASQASIDESEDKLLDITLLLTDESSSSYKVITRAAELFNQRSYELSSHSVKVLMTKTHLELHQALEQEASEHFEAKSPRSAKNRYFCQWKREEDVTRLSSKCDDLHSENILN